MPTPTSVYSYGTKKWTKAVLLPFVVFVVLLFVGIVIAAIYSSHSTGSSEANQNPSGEIKSAQPKVGEANQNPSEEIKSAQPKVANSIVVQPPPYKVVHQDCNNPIPLVVDKAASDDQIKSLLWKIRGDIKTQSYHDLGIQGANSCNHYYKSGFIEIFRGSRCASETYVEKSLPCGEGDHDVGSYQWGLGSDFKGDEAYTYSSDRTAHVIFDASSGDYLPPNIQALVDEQIKVRKLDQQIEVKTLNDGFAQSDYYVHFFLSENVDELWIRSDLFSDANTIKAFNKAFWGKVKPALCKVGFTTVVITDNKVFSAFNASDNKFWLECK